MKKNILNVVFALLLAVSLLAFASCAFLTATTTESTDSKTENTESTDKTKDTENTENAENTETTENTENTETTENTDNTEAENTEDTTEAEEIGFAVTFAVDEHASVTVYPTQDMTSGGEENATLAYSIDKTTGKQTKSGEGQVNFAVVLEEGYVIDEISIDNAEGYNNLKGSADTGVENGYRITKITADLTVTITTKVADAGENLEDGYQITFATDEHVSVTVYKTQDLAAAGEENATVAYSRDSATGALTKTDGQVNFVVVVEEGYEIDSITATEGTYKNIKDLGDGAWRVTKITGETTITIATKVAE